MKKLLLALVMWFAVCGVALAAVNINTATKDELVTLKGIGPKKADAIIEYRKKNGNFKTIDDLQKVEGIGPGIMKGIKSQISVSGPTTIDKSAATTKTPTSAKTDSTKATKTADSGKADTKSTNK